MLFPGSEIFFSSSLKPFERLYCGVLGIPIIGLRIRLRKIKKLLPKDANSILDAGCGRGVITRFIAGLFPDAEVTGIDNDSEKQVQNQHIAKRIGLDNVTFSVDDVSKYCIEDKHDLIISVDNLEHIKDDMSVLRNFYITLRKGGHAIIHVPHYYRRWPVFKWKVNFDVPGHMRPGYHLPELIEKVKSAGFNVIDSGFSYGFVENLVNNISYFITGAEEKNKIIYALLFPILNVIAWAGQWGNPKFGAGAWVIACKKS